MNTISYLYQGVYNTWLDMGFDTNMKVLGKNINTLIPLILQLILIAQGGITPAVVCFFLLLILAGMSLTYFIWFFIYLLSSYQNGSRGKHYFMHGVTHHIPSCLFNLFYRLFHILNQYFLMEKHLFHKSCLQSSGTKIWSYFVPAPSVYNHNPLIIMQLKKRNSINGNSYMTSQNLWHYK